jgi:hypothetical protein
MMAAGGYPDRFERLVYTRGNRDGFGDVKPNITYPPGGYLWGHLGEAFAGREEVLESERNRVRAEIRLRNYPDVKPLDRLVSVEWEETYQVETVRRGDNELILDVIRL